MKGTYCFHFSKDKFKVIIMYIPRRYEEKDREEIFRFITENNFGILVTTQQGVPVATHLPLLLEKNEKGEDVLVGHISKGNMQKLTLVDETRVLCIFPGPHAYISPGWYTAVNVPTWNYISVHIYGNIKIIEGEALKDALSRLVDHFEVHMPHPLKLTDIPEKMFNDDFRGIIGFQIKVEDIQAAYKLSQNRDETSYHNIINALKEGDEAAKNTAAAMEKKSAQLFKR